MVTSKCLIWIMQQFWDYNMLCLPSSAWISFFFFFTELMCGSTIEIVFNLINNFKFEFVIYNYLKGSNKITFFIYLWNLKEKNLVHPLIVAETVV